MPNLVGTGLNQVTTNSMLGGLAYQDPEHASIKNLDLKNLSQINSEIADTATNVFVYDTRKDSDGGAWRKRTQNTSWYNETLGTATRGTRKEFPAVAVIVAEATKVTIYDGDDPDLPMWMEFDAGEQTANGKMLQFWGTATTGVVSSVTMLNGVMVVGTNNGSSSGIYVGITAVNFASDSAYYRRNASNQYIVMGNTILDRNVNQYGGYASTGGLVGGNANDVAMTVLSNAPIDDTTGLSIPTIAVATDSGTSVIRDDETVADYTGFSPIKKVAIDSKYVYVYARSEPNDYIFKSTFLSSDGVYNTNITTGSGGFYVNSIGSPVSPLLKNMNATGTVVAKDHTYIRSGNDGIEILDGNVTTVDADTAVIPIVYITSDYNTGYMVGDIKGAFLSDTDTTNVTGAELITNGTFDSNVNNWVENTSTNTYSSGKMQITRSGGTGATSYQAFTTVSGTKYVARAEVNSSGSRGNLVIKNGTGWSGTTLGNVSGTNGQTLTLSTTFIATSTTSSVAFSVDSNGTSIIVDNVSVRLAEEDRSVNDNGLQVFGTVTKSAVATGAELVAYSGFSASNYLQQPYNSDLAPGTAAYSVSCWFKTGTSSGDQYIFDRNGGGAGSRNLLLIMNTSAGNANKFQFWHRDNTGNVTDIQITDKTITDNVWRQVVALNDGSTYKVYVDGEVSSVTSSQIRNVISDNNPPMFVGIRHTGGSTFMTGSMALFRYSKSAPSPEQIKKMYEDEKHLFQENAKATLYGSSDAVTALAFDDDTNLLHVGTSSGRSDFQGLRRINNTTTAVTTAITAQNEFIIEQ